LPDLLVELGSRLNKNSKLSNDDASPSLYEKVKIIIPNDWFFRYGWELDHDSFITLNLLLEKRVKFIMRQYIALNNSLGVSVSDCIKQFQITYGFPEHIWNYEAIKKDFDRHGRKTDFKVIKEFKKEIQINLLKDLAEAGIVSHLLTKNQAS
jgi:hypothetical protein